MMKFGGRWSYFIGKLMQIPFLKGKNLHEKWGIWRENSKIMLKKSQLLRTDGLRFDEFECKNR